MTVLVVCPSLALGSVILQRIFVEVNCIELNKCFSIVLQRNHQVLENCMVLIKEISLTVSLIL
jgi:hypothetical protein